MNILLVAGPIVLVIGGFVIFRIIKFKKGSRDLNEKRFQRIKPLYDKLEKSESLIAEDVMPFVKNVLTRRDAFLLLSEHNRIDIFPEEYKSLIKGAESSLANWLEFPTELDACPDEIQYLKRVTFDFDGKGNFVHYEVFKYRKNEPHWAAKNGWILGVVGPFFDDSQPYDSAAATFSRISSTLEKTTPDEEAKWVHENISMRR